MLIFDEWILPDGETHLQEWMTREGHRVDGRLTYQYRKFEVALARCKRRRTAVDVGAHVGLWSYWMVKHFRTLHAFEPDPKHCACWLGNIPSSRATLHTVALGEKSQHVTLTPERPGSSGNTRVELDPDGTTPMRTLDSYAVSGVDLLKIDCEGYEAFVIEGARETIARCKPVIVVEQKPRYPTKYGRGNEDAVRLLEAMGAHIIVNIGGDFVMTFEAHG